MEKTVQHELQEHAEAEEKRIAFPGLLREATPPQRQLDAKIDFSATSGPSGAWLECFQACRAKLGTGTLLALVGTRGEGKTQIAVELIRATCRDGRTAKYARVAEYFMDIKATFGKDGDRLTEREVVNLYCRPRLLVLDEAHEKAGSEWAGSLLNLLIDRRYADRKDTILVANLKRDDFVTAIGPSIASRMNETGGIIECAWGSFR